MAIIIYLALRPDFAAAIRDWIMIKSIEKILVLKEILFQAHVFNDSLIRSDSFKVISEFLDRTRVK